MTTIDDKTENKRAQVIAFYLPQYHPIAENDAWYGTGFTEWTNVRKSKPLFKGHYQPRIPADLGYYDLRDPQVREAQADLAGMAGIAAFCYYHYWFGSGKQLLETPLNEVIRLGKPDFPFCIAWANQTWYKKTWDPKKSVLNRDILIKQEYPGDFDIEAHFRTLLPAFRDKRYYKVRGKLLFVLYKAENIQFVDRFKEIWQQLAIQNNLPGFFFVAYADDIKKIKYPAVTNCNAVILSLKTEPGSFGKSAKLRKYARVIEELASKFFRRPLSVFPYSQIIDKLSSPVFKESKVYPVLIPNWDDTPRRAEGALIFNDSTPGLFKKHVNQILDSIAQKDDSDKIIFLKSWNEWGEGNYMEPDLKFGKGYINALREALDEFDPGIRENR